MDREDSGGVSGPADKEAGLPQSFNPGPGLGQGTQRCTEIKSCWRW